MAQGKFLENCEVGSFLEVIIFCLMAIILLLKNVANCSYFPVDSMIDGVEDRGLINRSTVKKSSSLEYITKRLRGLLLIITGMMRRVSELLTLNGICWNLIQFGNCTYSIYLK